MRIETISASELLKACNENDYLLLINYNGDIESINTKIANFIIKKGFYKPKTKTNYISYMPCCFSEYITFKIPFI